MLRIVIAVAEASAGPGAWPSDAGVSCVFASMRRAMWQSIAVNLWYAAVYVYCRVLPVAGMQTRRFSAERL